MHITQRHLLDQLYDEMRPVGAIGSVYGLVVFVAARCVESPYQFLSPSVSQGTFLFIFLNNSCLR